MQLNPERTAFDNLLDEFGLDVSAMTDNHLIHMGFDRLCVGRGMSVEAETLILYRIVAMQLAATLKIIVESGEATASEENVSGIMALLRASFDWSKAAPDRIRAESIASNLTESIDQTLNELGVFGDGDEAEAAEPLEKFVSVRSGDGILKDVQRCVRHAAREKLKFGLSRLQGYFEKLRYESKIRRWGLELERDYERKVVSSTQLWDPSEPNDCRNIVQLWREFGLGDAHTSEAVYDDGVALEVVFTWIISLYPDTSITSSELSDRLRRLQLRNTRALEGAHAKGRGIVMPLPIDQLVRELATELGPYS